MASEARTPNHWAGLRGWASIIGKRIQIRRRMNGMKQRRWRNIYSKYVSDELLRHYTDACNHNGSLSTAPTRTLLTIPITLLGFRKLSSNTEWLGLSDINPTIYFTHETPVKSLAIDTFGYPFTAAKSFFSNSFSSMASAWRIQRAHAHMLSGT